MFKNGIWWKYILRPRGWWGLIALGNLSFISKDSPIVLTQWRDYVDRQHRSKTSQGTWQWHPLPHHHCLLSHEVKNIGRGRRGGARPRQPEADFGSSSSGRRRRTKTALNQSCVVHHWDRWRRWGVPDSWGDWRVRKEGEFTQEQGDAGWREGLCSLATILKLLCCHSHFSHPCRPMHPWCIHPLVIVELLRRFVQLVMLGAF